ncbi:hypothetical protein LOZ12_004383 [Ophidiomyces ophidiicola]|nr:hypothetical protein LOZ62_006555 [Ophidiomyces ophidiicola]KAI2042336.1 hypothetical protein LOZ44_006187 [Ophidiomyces ophidiicola]KAI2052042.1 hypothetical protein LOZ38_002381 [Ophidiomyces ophidiicola]KAI2077571.1 hypothetical protein LOZ39_002136 [Ophidiomyces ophidiicola]KAI2081666.1 hypothetical protein LOZ37_001198 [Ophidiomyces ophidiicola]
MMDMDWDDIALERFEAQKREWILLLRASADGLLKLICPLRGHEIMKIITVTGGSFNCGIRVRFEDNKPDWFVRFPMAGSSMFRDEKTRNEVAVMQYIEKNTKIPIPRIVAYGMSHENPSGLGPFIIMEWVDGKKMSEILCGSVSEERGRKIDPEIDISVLKTLYGRMADILLELWDHDFEAIGGLHREDMGDSTNWKVKHRPLTLEMNELLRCTGISGKSFPKGPFHTTADYILNLANQQFDHLSEQRNSVWNSQDCREKYTCRHLFRALVPYFLSKHRADNRGPFKLFGDDLCPGNVLVNEETLEVTAVIDWEFVYTAPSLFAACPPWWLLLRKPEDWSGTTENFVEEYTPRLNLFLEAMKERETARGGKNEPGAVLLSSRMQSSMADRSFWFVHAIRKTLNLDNLYWSNLDVHYYGPRASIAERVYRSTTMTPMRHDREAFTRRKMDDLRQYLLERGEKQIEYDEVEDYLKVVSVQSVLAH